LSQLVRPQGRGEKNGARRNGGALAMIESFDGRFRYTQIIQSARERVKRM
jgi:hypothetical protein